MSTVLINKKLPEHISIQHALGLHNTYILENFNSFEKPIYKVIGFGRNISINQLRQVVEICLNYGFDYIHFNSQEMHNGNIIVGYYIGEQDYPHQSVSQQKSQMLKFTNPIMSILKNPVSTLEDLIDFIEDRVTVIEVNEMLPDFKSIFYELSLEKELIVEKSRSISIPKYRTITFGRFISIKQLRRAFNICQKHGFDRIHYSFGSSAPRIFVGSYVDSDLHNNLTRSNKQPQSVKITSQIISIINDPLSLLDDVIKVIEYYASYVLINENISNDHSILSALAQENIQNVSSYGRAKSKKNEQESKIIRFGHFTSIILLRKVVKICQLHGFNRIHYSTSLSEHRRILIGPDVMDYSVDRQSVIISSKIIDLLNNTSELDDVIKLIEIEQGYKNTFDHGEYW